MNYADPTVALHLPEADVTRPVRRVRESPSYDLARVRLYEKNHDPDDDLVQRLHHLTNRIWMRNYKQIYLRETDS